MPTTAELQQYAAGVASKYGLPVPLFLAQIQQESGWNPNATNPNSSAYGIAQILSGTAANPGYGVKPITDRSDPYASLEFAGAYDAALLRSTGSFEGMLNAYGTGTTAKPIREALAAVNGTGNINCGTVPWWPSFLCGYNSDGSPKSDKQLDETGTVNPSNWFSTLVSGAKSSVVIVLGLVFVLGAVFMFGRK